MEFLLLGLVSYSRKVSFIPPPPHFCDSNFSGILAVLLCAGLEKGLRLIHKCISDKWPFGSAFEWIPIFYVYRSFSPTSCPSCLSRFLPISIFSPSIFMLARYLVDDTTHARNAAGRFLLGGGWVDSALWVGFVNGMDGFPQFMLPVWRQLLFLLFYQRIEHLRNKLQWEWLLNQWYLICRDVIVSRTIRIQEKRVYLSKMQMFTE